MITLSVPSARVRAMHLLALSAFGIAQPAFARLSKQPDYLAVEGFEGLDVVLFALALLIVPPALMMAVEFIAGRIHLRALAIAHGFFIGLGMFVVLYRALDALPANSAVVVSVASALMGARLYQSWQPARLFLTISALAPAFFLALFLLKAPLKELSTTEVQVGAPKIAARIPVVLVIFDEFAISSLMTEGGAIDRASYPSFAAVANSSTWYRSATAVHEFTEWAVPAILTGRLPRNDQLPVLADHPHNLFTLLGRSYRVDAFEALTRICPKSLCREASRPLRARLHTVAGHLQRYFLTNELANDIPAWRDPPSQVSQFLASLRPTRRPQLAVLHVLLPHEPWQYLPSGREYEGGRSIDGYVWDRWTGDRDLVDEGYERYLLQVGYVDRLLGQIIRRLQAAGLWNRSLFIVTADHGVSFLPGEPRRLVNASNIADIAAVPLFVKRPWQRRGSVDDRSAKAIDIVPTIADVLGIAVPWKLDGRSLLARGRPFPSEVVVGKRTGEPVVARWKEVKAGRDATVARKGYLFGSGRGSLVGRIGGP